MSMHGQQVLTVFFICYSFVDLFLVFYVLMDSSVLIQYTVIHKYISRSLLMNLSVIGAILLN